MAFLPGLIGAGLPFLGKAVPYIGKALKGAIGGLVKGLEGDEPVGQVLKQTGVGALTGLIGEGDVEHRKAPKAIHDAKEYVELEPKPVKEKSHHPKVKVPKLVKHKGRGQKAKRK